MPETFSNTDRLFYETLQYCETKHFQQKIVTLPPSSPSYLCIISIPEVLGNTEGFSNEISRYSERTNFRREYVVPSPSPPPPPSSP